MLLDLTIYLLWIISIVSVLGLIFKRLKANQQKASTVLVEVKPNKLNRRQDN